MNKHASMNRAYRLVWSAARGAFVVAAENARGRSKSSRSLNVPAMSTLVIGLGLAGMHGPGSAQVVPATTVLPTGGNTNAYISPNGVPVVNINTANNAGVSHNQFTRYDVESNGLVLNNGNMAQSARQSQLAGQVVANVNLGAEARVILNEVVSTNRSTLAGFTEVLGGKADVIVANPYGITCSGCGFINTDRVTLSTGTPNFGLDGSVAGFRVQRGDVLVNGGGVNATAQQILDIVTRSVRLDGQVNTAAAGSLGIYTGANIWSYASRDVSGSTSSAGATPAYAIDSTALGGMYAGRIRIIATEAGVGVRMLGEAAATVDDFTLDAAGKVLVQNRLSAQRDLKISYTGDAAGGANAIESTGVTASLSAQRDLALSTVHAGTTLGNTDLKAGRDLSVAAASLNDFSTANNSRVGAANTTVTVANTASIDGSTWGAGGKLTATVGALDVGSAGSTIYSGSNTAAADRRLEMVATTGDLNLANANVIAPSDVILTAQQGAIGTGPNVIVQAQRDLALTARTALNNSGKLLAAQDIAVRAASTATALAVTNNALVQAGRHLSVGAAGQTVSLANNADGAMLADGIVFRGSSLTNGGALQGTQSVAIDAAQALTNSASGVLLNTAAGATMAINVARLDNAGMLQSAGTLTGTVAGASTNSGTLHTMRAVDGGSNGNLILQTGSLSNTGTLASAGAATVATTSGTMSNQGLLSSAGNLNLTIATLLQNIGSSSQIRSGAAMSVLGASGNFSLANQGLIGAAGAITLGETARVVDLLNAAGGVISSNGLTLRASTLRNQGRMQALSGANISGSSLHNQGSGAVLVTGLDGSASGINISGALTNEGAIHGGGDLTVGAHSMSNSSTAGLSALGNLYVSTTLSGIDNSGALYAGNTLTASANNQTITNRSTGTMDATNIAIAAGTFSNYNTVISTANTSIATTNAFNNLPTGGVPNVIVGSIDYGAITTPYDTGEYNCNVWGDYCDQQWVRAQNFTVTQALDGAVPVQKGQIIAGNTLTINYGAAGTNTASLISAPNVHISGSGAFANNDLHLDRIDYSRRWRVYKTDSTFGSLNYDYFFPTTAEQFGCNDGGCFAGTAGSEAAAMSGSYWLETGRETIQVFSAGIYATNLTFSGGSLKNLGSPYQRATSVSSAGAVAPAQARPVSVAPPTAFAGLNLSLPSNPNGYFVTSKNPESKYLVETNPLFDVGSNFVGSDYLAERLGFNPDTVQKRLGDANYEAKLIRDQLIAQTGSNILKGKANEAAQMQALMDSAATQAKTLGLAFGQPLSKEQAASLTEDMVWMVEQVVGGHKVIVPVVYLAQSTRDAIETGGPVISATNATIKADTLANTGGTIAGDKLDIVTKGNLTNTGGTIKGGDVSLTSTEGSIINQTLAETRGGNDFARTVIGATGSIQSTGNLNLDAAKDIVVKGAEVKAGGDASLAAGNNVSFDTIVDKRADATYSASQGLWGLSSQSSSTHTATATNIGSTLQTGGNLAIKSGNDTTIAGSSVNVGGNLAVDAKGDLNVLSRQDTVETTNTSSRSGLGVGGGLYGATETATNKFQGRNAGSAINVGGDATLTTSNTLTVQGSKLSIDGDAKIAADDVQVLAGQDVDRSTTTTTTTSFLKFAGAEGSAEAGAGAGARAGAGAGAKDGAANAGAGASAEAGAQAGARATAGVTLAETTTTNTFDLSQRSVGSALNIGGNLSVDSNKSITLQGANVNVGGDADLKAKDINVLAAQDVNISTSKTTTTSIGIYVDSNNTAQADASAGAGANAQATSSADRNGRGGSAGAGAGAQAGAQANASANSDTKIDLVRTTTTESSNLNITNTGSVINVGGKLAVTAENKLTVQGSDISGEQGVSLKAKDMAFLAAEDVSISTTKTTTVSAGLYVSGVASADAGAKAGLQGQATAQGGARGALNQDSGQASVAGSGSAEAGAGASAKLGAGWQATTTTTSTTDSSTTARVSSIRSGSGDVERSAENRILDVGTAIEAGGNFTQSATTIDSLAARNTSFSSTETESHTAKVGVYLQGNAEARASGSVAADSSAGVLGGNGMGSNNASNATAGANASVGIEAEYAMDKSRSSSSSSQAVVSTIKAGGNVSSASTGKTTFEGTQIQGGTGVELAAKDIDFRAARDTATSSDSSMNVGVKANIGMNLGSDGAVEGGASAGFATDERNASSSTAVVGGIQSGGNLTIKTQGDARFEGTDIGAAGNASIAAGGNLRFDAARNEQSESSRSINAEASVSISKSGGAGQDSSSKGIGVTAGGGFSTEKSNSSEAVTGSINVGGNLTLSAGKNATFEGTQIGAAGDTDVSAGGNVAFNAARNTSSSESTNFSASLELGKSDSSNAKTGEASSSKSGSLSVEGGFNRERASEAVTGTLETGGNLRIRSGGDTTFAGTDVAAGGSAAVNAGGSVNFKAAENTSESIGVSASIGAGGSTSTTTPAKPAAPASPGGGAAAVVGTGASAAPSGPTTERERSGSVGLEAGYASTTERAGGAISAGAGLQITAGKDVNLEGTKVRSEGDTAIRAAGDVNLTAARSTSVGIGISLGGEGASKTTVGDPTQDSSSKSGTVGVQGGVSVSNAGATLESGGALSIASGGKTTMVNTETKAADGTQINAADGVTRVQVADVDVNVKLSASASAEQTPAPAAPDVAAPTANAAPAVPVASATAATAATASSVPDAALASGEKKSAADATAVPASVEKTATAPKKAPAAKAKSTPTTKKAASAKKKLVPAVKSVPAPAKAASVIGKEPAKPAP